MNTRTIREKSLGILLSLALALSLVAVAVPVQPAYAATWYVDGTLGTDDGSHGTSAGAGAFRTIQYAIDDARVVAADTIIVAAGTYTEDLTITKGITLRSQSGAASTTIQLVSGVGIDISAASAKLGGALNTGFTITPHATNTTFDIQISGGVASVEVSYNTINTTGTASQAVSIAAAGATGLNINHNTFTLDAGDVAVDCNGPMATLTVDNNTITGPAGGNANSVSFYECTVSTATISNNNITAATSQIRLGNTLASSVSGITYSGNTFTGTQGGILVQETSEAATQRLTNLTVQRNTFVNGTPDTFSFMLLSNVEAGDVDFTTIHVNYNSFPVRRAGTDSFATVTNGTGGGTLDAEYNWWGSSTGPDTSGGDAQVSANVDYTPWSQVAVTYPNATGVRMKGGTPYNITWTSYSSTSATATIYYSTNSGSSYTTIGSVGNPAQGANTYSWTVPAINNTTCKIKVTITDGVLTYSDESDNNFTIDSTNPSVTLGPPVGGECWIGNTAHNITWIATDNFAGNLNYVLDYSINNGSTWTNIVTQTNQTQGSKTYSWTTPAATNSSACKVRVTASEYDCALNTSTATSNAFTIDSTNPSVTLTAPVGGESWTAGTTQSITWIASDNLPGNLTILLELSTNGGVSFPTTIATLTNQAQSNGTYTWTLPCGTTTTQVRARATDCAGNNSSYSASTNFNILDATAPTITITSPNGGESWAAGSTQTICWTATDNCAGTLTYNLYYCTSYDGTCANCNIPIASLAAQPQGSNCYSWTVPTPVATSNTCRVRITATDASNNTGSACSANNFSIVRHANPPTVTLTTPNGGQTWQAGTCQTISWTASDPADATAALTYLLEYSSNNGGAWTAIVTMNNKDQGTVTFGWAVPNTPTATYLVRVTATGPGGSASDTSDAVFTVTVADAGLTSVSVTLQTGWNLVSLPLQPTCTNVESVMANVLTSVSSVWYYNTSSGTWPSYAPGAPSGLTTMTDGKGYWVYMSAGGPFTWTFQGRKCPAAPGLPPQYSFTPGWNLVGFKSTAAATVQSYLGLPCPSTVYSTPIYEYNTTTGNYDTKACGDNMAVGKGYWVYYFSAGTVSPGCN